MVVWIIQTIAMFIFQLFMTIVGILTIPFMMLFMEPFKPEHKEVQFDWQRRFKCKWYDNIFGNKEDGIADYYYAKRFTPINVRYYEPTFWRTYNWLAFRNPIHNLALRMGVNEVIVGYTWKGRVDTEDRIGHEGWVYSIAIGRSGKKYRMFRLCKLLYKNYGIEFNFGYKNFNVHKEELPKHYKYSFTVSLNPIKRFEK